MRKLVLLSNPQLGVNAVHIVNALKNITLVIITHEINSCRDVRFRGDPG